MSSDYQNVLAKKQAHDVAVRNYLRSKGWKLTCDNPASVWLWTKIINGKAHAVPEQTALLFEQFLEPQDDSESAAIDSDNCQ
jgi:hypothetical protein